MAGARKYRGTSAVGSSVRPAASRCAPSAASATTRCCPGVTMVAPAADANAQGGVSAGADVDEDRGDVRLIVTRVGNQAVYVRQQFDGVVALAAPVHAGADNAVRGQCEAGCVVRGVNREFESFSVVR